MTGTSFAQEFRNEACHRMQESRDKILACLEHFDDQSIWERANDNSLSMANQVLHLCGNITQYILSGLGGRPDQRQRDDEFSTRSGFTKQELAEKFLRVAEAAIAEVAGCPDEKLMLRRTIQGFHLSGMGMILHVVEHWSYHTGQIVAWTKQRINRPMGFYDQVDLNVRNEGSLP